MYYGYRCTFILIFLLCLVNSSFAQTDSVGTYLKYDKIGVDDLIDVVYTYNGDNLDRVKPSFNDFSVEKGPVQAKSTNMTLVSGAYVNSVSYKLTYTLKPKHEGILTIGPLTFHTTDGHDYKSREMTVTVVPGSMGAAVALTGPNSMDDQMAEIQKMMVNIQKANADTSGKADHKMPAGNNADMDKYMDAIRGTRGDDLPLVSKEGPVSIYINHTKIGLEDTMVVKYAFDGESYDHLKTDFKHFTVVAGPIKYSSSNTTMANGVMATSTRYSMTYKLLADRTGVFTLKPATFYTTDGTGYKSGEVEVTVAE